MPRLAAAAVLALLLLPSASVAQDPPPSPPMPGKFELVGHNPLMMRGMNAALAVLDGYAYVGSRTDGSHANAGVFVLDVKDPGNPTIVGEMGPPHEGLPTQTSRELRILPDQKLLFVLNHQCNEAIHRCVAPSNTGVGVLPSNFKVYDIAGENAANPQLVATVEPSAQGPQTPHEFFLWSDPKRPSRVLMYYSDPGGSEAEVVVADYSRVREGIVTEIAKFKPEALDRIHSMTVSNDGRRLFLAGLKGGFLEADTSEVAEGKADPKVVQLTAAEDAPTWPGPGAHSAISLPGRPGTVMITDEVYGRIPGLLSDHGCPWGWVRFIDDSKPAKPVVVSEYKLPVNEPAYCEQVSDDRNSLSSWAAHNPTLTERLAILTWHSAGLQAIDTTNPLRPTGAAEYRPEPLPVVQTEDPALSSGPDKVVMWSFPTIVDGLIYVVDLRNGLYILRYKGPHEEEVARTKFNDGASNSGDVQRMEKVPGAVATRPGAPAGAGPAVGGPAPCQAGAPRLTRSGLGAFRLGMTRGQVELRGGPPSAVRRSSLRYCVEGGGNVFTVFRRNRVALVATTARRVPGASKGMTPGAGYKARKARKVGRGLVIVRGRKTSTVARVRSRKVVWVGVVTGKPNGRTLRRLIRGSGL